LLRGIRCGELMHYPLIFNEIFHGVVLEIGPIIDPNGLDFTSKIPFCLLGKDDEFLVSFLFRLEKAYPRVS
jgi:hypothetical protein